MTKGRFWGGEPCIYTPCKGSYDIIQKALQFGGPCSRWLERGPFFLQRGQPHFMWFHQEFTWEEWCCFGKFCYRFRTCPLTKTCGASPCKFLSFIEGDNFQDKKGTFHRKPWFSNPKITIFSSPQSHVVAEWHSPKICEVVSWKLIVYIQYIIVCGAKENSYNQSRKHLLLFPTLDSSWLIMTESCFIYVAPIYSELRANN